MKDYLIDIIVELLDRLLMSTLVLIFAPILLVLTLLLGSERAAVITDGLLEKVSKFV